MSGTGILEVAARYELPERLRAMVVNHDKGWMDAAGPQNGLVRFETGAEGFDSVIARLETASVSLADVDGDLALLYSQVPGEGSDWLIRLDLVSLHDESSLPFANGIKLETVAQDVYLEDDFALTLHTTYGSAGFQIFDVDREFLSLTPRHFQSLLRLGILHWTAEQRTLHRVILFLFMI